MQRRRKYSNEYKLETVRLTSEPGVSVAQIARDLGLNAGLLASGVTSFAVKETIHSRARAGLVTRRWRRSNENFRA